MTCLVPGGLDLALRHGVLHSAAFGPHQCAVRDAHAERAARIRGLMPVARVEPDELAKFIREIFGAHLRLKATWQLARETPDASACRRFSTGQILVLLGLVVGLSGVGLVMGMSAVLAMLGLASSLLFGMNVALRLFAALPRHGYFPPLSPAVNSAELPVYSVLVPLFRETRVLDQLLSSLGRLDYPVEKLDIKLLLEEDDLPMREAMAQRSLPGQFDVIVVPRGAPQTKPRALNYGLHFCRGPLLTIYDSEDVPDPRQLRLAAARFAHSDARLACLQAGLSFYNATENWMTRQFTAEYAGLFRVLLPLLAANNMPLPLGGTSNHFRREALDSVGAWDPFNVTEDADLGYRLALRGYRCGVLDSMTMEEACSDYRTWRRQRQRWLKGFLQTWLVHSRDSIKLFRATGADGFWVFQSLSLGVFLTAFAHPFWLAHSLWYLFLSEGLSRNIELAHALLFGLNITLLVTGYASGILLSARGLASLKHSRWWLTLATMPFYWLMAAPSAWLALWDFATRPHHWHKTPHGLSRQMSPPINPASSP